MLDDLRYRIRALLHGRKVEQELDEELRFHFERQVEKNRMSGMTEHEARRRARLVFGGHEQMKEDCREARGAMFMTAILRDLRFALRTIRRHPAFAGMAIATLALGIGPNTAIFTVVNAVLLRPLPYANPSELITWHRNESLPDVDDIRSQSTRFFSTGGAVNPEPMDYTGGGEPLAVHAGFVNAGLFEVLGVPPMFGRVLSAAEDTKGGPRVVVLAYPFWRDHLGADPGILGKSVMLSGNSYTVIGVMPKGFAVPDFNLDLFVSLWVAYPEAASFRGVHFMRSYWRLRHSVTLDQVRQGMNVIDARLAGTYPEQEAGRKTLPLPLQEQITGNVRPALEVLFGAVCIVLLIASANFAGLLTARGVARQHEFVVRAALGGGRSRLLRQALTESTLLALMGGGAGLLIARIGTCLILAAKPAALAHLNEISMDFRAVFFGLSVSMVSGLVFGAAPAWSTSRTGFSDALKRNDRTSTESHVGLSLRKTLVVVQLAMAVILLAGAGLLIKSFLRLRFVDSGFNADNVTVVPISLPAARYDSIASQTRYRREVLERLNALPGAEAAMVGDVPLNGNELSHSFTIQGSQPARPGEEPQVDTFCVMGDYFHVLQIPLRAGRILNDSDREDHPLAAVVNQALAREYFAGQNPVGRRIRWARDTGPPRWMTIVGVVGDVKQSSLAEPADPAVFTPFPQSNEAWRRWMSIVVRSSESPATLVPAIKRQIWSVDERIPLDAVTRMDAVLGLSLSARRFDTALLTLFASLATALAAVGVYSVMAYSVTQRTHEIGIRMAVGARQVDVLKLVVVQGAQIAAVGLILGLVAAFALTRLLKSLLFEVTPTDPLTLAAATLLAIVLALLASYIPARRASRVDPMSALRYE